MGQMHVVRQGECLSTIAARYGFDSWRLLYDHPQNRDFRKKRPNPDVILAGDRVFIPDPRERIAECLTQSSHKFRRKAVKTSLRIRLVDKDGEPIAQKRYLLRLGSKELEGETDAGGCLEHPIPPSADRADLSVEDLLEEGKTHRYSLRIGHLDPIEELAGVQARLNNLGYPCGSSNGEMNADTVDAIEQFQGDQGLAIDGDLTDETRSKLEKSYGC
jgi:Putative peptidoglycan binding domain